MSARESETPPGLPFFGDEVGFVDRGVLCLAAAPVRAARLGVDMAYCPAGDAPCGLGTMQGHCYTTPWFPTILVH